MLFGLKHCEHVDKAPLARPKAVPESPKAAPEPPKELPAACNVHKIDWAKQPYSALSAPTRDLLWKVAYAHKFGYTQKPGQWWMNSGQRELSKYTYCIAAALMLNGQYVKIVNNYRRGNQRSLVEYLAVFHHVGVQKFGNNMYTCGKPPKWLPMLPVDIRDAIQVRAGDLINTTPANVAALKYALEAAEGRPDVVVEVSGKRVCAVSAAVYFHESVSDVDAAGFTLVMNRTWKNAADMGEKLERVCKENGYPIY